jgi:hypothetical protein
VSWFTPRIRQNPSLIEPSDSTVHNHSESTTKLDAPDAMALRIAAGRYKNPSAGC